MANTALFFMLLGFASVIPMDAAGSQPKVSHRHGKPTRGLRQGSAAKLKKSMIEAVDEVLGSGHGAEQAELESIREVIEPMWASLAKNSQGRIDKRLLQYVVQRYFLRKHGLSMVGLEASHANNSHSEASLLSNFAPNYVRKVLEGANAQNGFVMEDAVGMIAAILRLIQHSTGSILEDAYRAMGKNSQKDLGRPQMGEVMEDFMLRWMLGEDKESIELLEANATLKEISFEDWPHIAAFVQGRVTMFEFERSHPKRRSKSQVGTWNSLHPHFSYSDAEAIVGDVALTFGSYWETECDNTKDALIKMDKTGSGRVKLSDFHGAALNGEWRFSESKEYLRQLGALDESSAWRGPRVIITNYVQAPSNCIISADHYRVCCANECENHLAELESVIRAPIALPEQILPVVERLSSGFDDNEPRLTRTLTKQLHEIAKANSGKVPLHGRLFAQWLHYVFPLDCPFPHKSNTTTTLTPLAFGDDYMASEEEMNVHKEAKTNDVGATTEEEWLSQWSHEEELLTEHLHAPWEADFSSSILILFIIGGICCLLVKSGIISFGGGKDVLPTRMKSHYV
jgi:hypothetical protein